MTEPTRCCWAQGNPLDTAYHDTEWGVPVHDSRMLWEMLMLEGFQAGLSWSTILKKRDGFHAAFAGWDPAKVAAFGPADVERLMADPGIVRARAKIEAAIGNARAYLDFLAGGLGGEIVDIHTAPDGQVLNAHVRFGDTTIMVSEPREPRQASRSEQYLYVADADAAMARAISARSSSSDMSLCSTQRRLWLAISQPASCIAATTSGLRFSAIATPNTVAGSFRSVNIRHSRQKPAREPYSNIVSILA